MNAAAMILYARLERIPKHTLYCQLYCFALEQKRLGNVQAYHDVMRIYWTAVR